MPLSANEIAYFSHLAFSRKLAIDRKFQLMRERLGVEDEGIRTQVFIRQIKDYAKETIDSRVEDFIETCKKFGKFPDTEDIRIFIEESKPYVINKKVLFEEFRTSLFGPDIPSAMGDAIAHTLAFDLQSIFREALFPLELLHIEGQAREEPGIAESAKSLKNPDNNDLIEKLLTPHQRIYLEAIYGHQKLGESMSVRALLMELGDRLPVDFDYNSIRGAYLRDGKVTILGIGLLDPESEIVKRADRVIKDVRVVLLGNPDLSEITVQDIARVSELEEDEIGRALKDIGEFHGVFHDHYSASANGIVTSIKVVKRTFDDYRKFSSINDVLMDLLHQEKPIDIETNVNRRRVFIVHGRNEVAKKALVDFLRAINLSPIEWLEAKAKVIELKNDPNPYIGDILAMGFSMARATVVLFTPDDLAQLRPEYWGRDEEDYETQASPQPGQNVLFEAGMAMGKHPERTILIEIGKHRPMSDVLGRHILRMDDTPQKRTELRDLL